MKKSCFTKYLPILNLVVSTLLLCSPAIAEDGDLLKTPVRVKCEKDIDDLAESYAIEYQSDGLSISGFLFVPKTSDSNPGPFPCVIYNRGGNNIQFGREYDFGALEITGPISFDLASLASKGYVVVASQYRGFGPDADWEKADFDQFGGKDVNDVTNLIPLLRKLQNSSHPVELPEGISKKVDSKRIAMYGWSRGGMMTYLALRQLAGKSDTMPITTAVIGAGPTNLFSGELERPNLRFDVHQALIPNYDTHRAAELKERSAVYWADELPKSVSMLLLHGTTDDRVNISQSRELANQLHQLGHPHQIIFAEQFDHGFNRRPMDQPLNRDSPMHITWREVLVTEWLNSHLKPVKRK